MTRTNPFSRKEGRRAPEHATAATCSSASSARAKSLTVALLLPLLLPTSFLLNTPTASADQVPAGSGSYYHVGDNVFGRGSANLTFTLPNLVDGNDTSLVVTGAPSGNTGSYNGACSNAISGSNDTVQLGTSSVDLVRYRFGVTYSSVGGGYGNCVSAGLILQGGATITIVAHQGVAFGQTTIFEGWLNLTSPTNVTGFWIMSAISGCNCAGISRTHLVHTLEGYLKNATASDPILAIANNAAANVQCYATGAFYGNFASNSYTAPFGTFYLMIPSIMPAATTSSPNPMTIYAPLGGVTSTFHGWSRVTPDITGLRSDAVAIWKVTTSQAGLPIYIKPAGTANVNATDTVCSLSRVGAMFSSTLANGYVTAPLQTWGGGANDLWGVVHMANAYPVNAVYDSDLSGQVPTIFALNNMTFGAQLFSSGTVGLNATVSVATLPAHVRVGNGILIALGQNASAQGTSTSYQILVNGNPASVIANSGLNAQGFQYALFYVDDVAGRNGLNNSANNVGHASYRPFLAETYAITLAGGFDPNYPVYAGNTYGLTGHAGIACFTLCGANLYNYASTLPAQNSNVVVFNVTNATTGLPVVGARVLNTNNTTAILTNAAGYANFTNTFTPVHFTITAPGYAATCADFYYKSQSTPVSGASDSLGCGYVIGASATFNVLLGTTTSVAGNAGGTVTIGGSVIQVTFNVTSPTFQVGQLIQVTVNRTQGANLWVVLYQLDSAGNPQRAGGFTPYDWTSAQPNSLPVTWPDGRTLTAADTGSYVLTVSTISSATSNGTLLAFDPIGVAQPAPTVGTSLLTNLNVAAQNDINRQATVNGALRNTVTEATVQQHFLEWLDWFPRTDLFLPNAVLYPALFMLGALMLRFGRNEWGR